MCTVQDRGRGGYEAEGLSRHGHSPSAPGPADGDPHSQTRSLSDADGTNRDGKRVPACHLTILAHSPS